jgi:hypothetical protein
MRITPCLLAHASGTDCQSVKVALDRSQLTGPETRQGADSHEQAA